MLVRKCACREVRDELCMAYQRILYKSDIGLEASRVDVLILVGEPLAGQTGPIQSMSYDQVIEIRRVLFPRSTRKYTIDAIYQVSLAKSCTPVSGGPGE